jgi:hypothetical protein
MARIETVRLIDDLTGGDADESVLFGIDGVMIEIDLSTANAAKLRELLAPYVAAGTPARKVPPGRVIKGAPAMEDRERRERIRAWARDNGIALSNRGQISKSVMEAFRAGSKDLLWAWARSTMHPSTMVSPVAPMPAEVPVTEPTPEQEAEQPVAKKRPAVKRAVKATTPAEPAAAAKKEGKTNVPAAAFSSGATSKATAGRTRKAGAGN